MIGFIGLGTMGSRMAANLKQNGHELVLYNRTRAKAESLSANVVAGLAEDPAEVGRKADVVFTMLSDPEAVRQVAAGNSGFLETLRPKALWVDCTTVDPNFSREMAAAAARRNVRFLDAPVAGTRQPAADGNLVFFVGGAKADIEACKPYLSAMGRKVVHVGDTGMGAALKMVFNLMLGTAMASFSEAASLGDALGIDRNLLFETLVGSPVAAPFIESKSQKITDNDFEPDFRLRWMFKDLHLATQSAYRAGAPLPVGAAARELFALAVRQGFSDQDFSAVFRFLNETRPKTD